MWLVLLTQKLLVIALLSNLKSHLCQLRILIYLTLLHHRNLRASKSNLNCLVSVLRFQTTQFYDLSLGLPLYLNLWRYSIKLQIVFILPQTTLPIDSKVKPRPERNLQQILVLLLIDGLVDPVLNRGIPLQMLLVIFFGRLAERFVVELLALGLDDLDIPAPNVVILFELGQHVGLSFEFVVEGVRLRFHCFGLLVLIDAVDDLAKLEVV